jgi:hypothetical protein
MRLPIILGWHLRRHHSAANSLIAFVAQFDLSTNTLFSPCALRSSALHWCRSKPGVEDVGVCSAKSSTAVPSRGWRGSESGK